MLVMKPYSQDLRRKIVAAAWERADFLRGASGVAMSASTVRRLLRKLGFSQ